MHVEDFVSQKGESLEGVERLENHETALVDMFLDGAPRTVQSLQRIVAQQNTDAGIIVRSTLLVELMKAVEEEAAAMPGSHPDFHDEHFLRQPLLAFQVAQQGPKIGHAVGYGIGMVGIRLPARQRPLIPLAGCGFPIFHAVPVEAVELPGNAGAKRLEILQRQPVLLRHSGAQHGAHHGRLQASRNHLPGIHLHMHDGRSFVAGFLTLRNQHHLAKVFLVLEPVQLDAQAREFALLDVPLLQQGVERLNDILSSRGRLPMEVIHLQDHSSNARLISLPMLSGGSDPPGS
jgi:hypothetical protein